MSTLLICTESSLPPNVHGKTRGYLEIEVTKINFITSYTEAAAAKAPTERFIAKSHKKSNSGATSIATTTAHITPIGIQGASAKFTWWGECSETSSCIRIVRASVAKGTTLNGVHHQGNNNYNNSKDCRNNCLQQQQPQTQLKCSKVRYSIQTCLRLFLEYLQTCEPLEISVSTNVSDLPLARAQVRLPTVFVRKFAANYTGASNFEHKSKIYALYTIQQGNRNSHKCGELQLKFKIMFAPNAKQMLQEQLQSTLKKELQLDTKDGMKMSEQSCAVNNKFVNTDSSRKSSKTDEIVEAMKKIDAKLVAYLAGEDMKPKDERESSEEALTLERLQCNSPISQMVGEMVQARFREQQLKIYQRVNTLKMHLEALCLQPAGTKYMELLEEDIKPIFTVESQLSQELIKDVPRYDMHHVMQFESGQFQSLTQCTRFAQDAQREIHIRQKEVTATAATVEDVNKNNVELELNFGKLHFIVWWRQPGTCLNEMLGMAIFDLEELYQASLLEQCKCLAIKRRDVHLANLYFKISFQLRRNSNGEIKMLKESRENSVVKELYAAVPGVFDADDQQSTKKQSAYIKKAENVENTVTRSGDRAAKSADAKKVSNNNNSQVDTLEFTAETTKVRLLKGYIYANETRNLPEAKTRNYYLVCRRFWHSEPSAIAMQTCSDENATSDDHGNFKYQEQFSVLNDEIFLHSVEKQFLQLEIWQRNRADNGNSNAMEPYGLVRLPLHQYFIAYRDAAITNHLCKGKLPVISIDAWAPIMSYEHNELAGEIKCLLAIGSEAQIEHLKDSRSLMRSSDAPASVGDSTGKLANLFSNEPLEHRAAVAEQLKIKLAQFKASSGNARIQAKHNNTAELLDMLQSALMAPPSAAAPIDILPNCAAIAAAATANHIMQTEPIKINNKCFKFALSIKRAKNLPLNPVVKGSKKGSAKRNNAATSPNIFAKQNRFPPNEPPSVYVTFQAEQCGQGKLYKSHEGMVYATNIVEKSTQPVWQQRFGATVPLDYLNNPQKRFILKVWKKAATDLAQCRLQPTPMEDAILGFAAIDLSVFLRGLHIGGWFNVVDFNGRVIGQLELQCHPIDDVQQLPEISQQAPHMDAKGMESAASMNNFIDQFEKSLELSHLNLGQAIKRKYSDLEQISQRLRTRLADVTGVQMAPKCDINKLEHDLNALPLVDEAEFAELDEFEHDLNTPPQFDVEEEVVEANQIAGTDAKTASSPCAQRQPDTQ